MKLCIVKDCPAEVSSWRPQPPFGNCCEEHLVDWDQRFRTGTFRKEYVVSLKPAFTDERGDITNILNCDIGHVALISFKKGTVRANHYHPAEYQSTQFMHCISGSYHASSQEVAYGQLVEGTWDTQIIRAGDLHEAPPMLAHRYDALEDSLFLNINTKARHADKFGIHTLPMVIAKP